MPLASNFAVKDYYAFGLEDSLVLFNASSYGRRVGTGVLNREQSTVAIGQSTAISYEGPLLHTRVIPKSYPANLKDGLILKVAGDVRSDYFDVKLDEQNQLQATRINCLSNMVVGTVHEEFSYSLDWQPIDDGTQQNGQYVELSKRSLETGELSSFPTMNSEAMGELAFESGCRVGNKFFWLHKELLDQQVPNRLVEFGYVRVEGNWDETKWPC
ncbi:hypothetical protein M3Y94_00424400 [Aphelenchoides besseyi]|nr:hypothetical protein M3Y94_00424400 [Aphelenchoides besseyi]